MEDIMKGLCEVCQERGIRLTIKITEEGIMLEATKGISNATNTKFERAEANYPITYSMLADDGYKGVIVTALGKMLVGISQEEKRFANTK